MGNDLTRDSYPLRGDNTKDFYKYWRTVVEAFSECRLTFYQDKLPAVAGIAEDLSKSLRDRYIGGMWETDLLHSLLWTVIEFRDFITLPPEYRAPTWSWASIDAVISYEHESKYSDNMLWENEPEETVHSCILDINSTDFAGGQENEGQEWSLRIKGPLRRVMKVLKSGPSYVVNSKVIDLMLNLTSLRLRPKTSEPRGIQLYSTP